MLSGIRLIASAAAKSSSVRSGGCTPRLARSPAGQRNIVGFIRLLSAASKDIPASKIHMRLADINSALKLGPLIRGIEVHISPHTHDCFLDTQVMGMCYQTAQQPWSYGNIALNWIIKHDTVDKDAIRFSNYVTERANEAGTPPGVPETNLETSNQLIDGGYNLHVLGSGLKFYLEENPTSPGDLAISTYLNEDPANSDKYYLQPMVGGNSIIAKMGDPLYIFAVVAPQPFPTIPTS